MFLYECGHPRLRGAVVCAHPPAKAVKEGSESQQEHPRPPGSFPMLWFTPVLAELLGSPVPGECPEHHGCSGGLTTQVPAMCSPQQTRFCGHCPPPLPTALLDGHLGQRPLSQGSPFWISLSRFLEKRKKPISTHCMARFWVMLISCSMGLTEAIAPALLWMLKMIVWGDSGSWRTGTLHT